MQLTVILEISVVSKAEPVDANSLVLGAMRIVSILDKVSLYLMVVINV